MNQELDITVLSGVSKGDVFHFALDPNAPITIGRAPECRLVLQDPAVSRQHLKIELREDGFYMADLGSSHGTVLMGFKLSSENGSERRLNDNDEFKIGEAIFRINFNDSSFVAAAPEPEPQVDDTATSLPPLAKASSWKTMLGDKRIIGAVLALVLALVFLLPEEKKPGLPKQLSNKPMNMPQERVIGYWPKGKKKNGDRRHIDKAIFMLPGADLVVEFDYRSEVPVEVLIDDVAIQTLDPAIEIWQQQVMVVRDLLMGTERRLTFDNPDWPRRPGKKGRKKKWAVRNVRVTPLSRDLDITFDQAISNIVPVSGRLRASADAHYVMLRGLQIAIVEALREMNLDAIGAQVDLEFDPPSGPDVKIMLQGIQSEREAIASIDDNERHLEALMDTTVRIDAELWRRSNSSYARARFAATVKDYIDAHDSLIATMEMFPDEADYRWIVANRMFVDKKIVPKKVREGSNKYRVRKEKRLKKRNKR